MWRFQRIFRCTTTSDIDVQIDLGNADLLFRSHANAFALQRSRLVIAHVAAKIKAKRWVKACLLLLLLFDLFQFRMGCQPKDEQILISEKVTSSSAWIPGFLSAAMQAGLFHSSLWNRCKKRRPRLEFPGPVIQYFSHFCGQRVMLFIIDLKKSVLYIHKEYTSWRVQDEALKKEQILA